MHELSIAMSIVESVEENLPDQETKVEKVFLKIGELSGVVKDALLFSFDIAAADSSLNGAAVEIESIPVVVRCSDCELDTELGSPPVFKCKECGRPVADIISGKELEIVSVALAS